MRPQVGTKTPPGQGHALRRGGERSDDPSWNRLIHPEPNVLEREYSASSCVGGNYQPFIQAYLERSAQAVTSTQALGAQWHRLAYGSSSSQTVLLCQPTGKSATPRSVLVFFHGGYWQELDSASSLWAATECARRGHAFAAVDYTLAPHASLGKIVAECRAAVACLVESAATLGLDPERFVLAGSSAGAHLAACVALPCPGDRAEAGPAETDGGAERRRAAKTESAANTSTQPTPPPNWRPCGLVLASGIYWLEPLVQTGINDALGLDAQDAFAWSPGEGPATACPPTLLVWGDNETAAFKAQSQRMAERLRRRGGRVTAHEAADRNHFNLILDLSDPGTELGASTLQMLGSPLTSDHEPREATASARPSLRPPTPHPPTPSTPDPASRSHHPAPPCP